MNSAYIILYVAIGIIFLFISFFGFFIIADVVEGRRKFKTKHHHSKC